MLRTCALHSLAGEHRPASARGEFVLTHNLACATESGQTDHIRFSVSDLE